MQKPAAPDGLKAHINPKINDSIIDVARSQNPRHKAASQRKERNTLIRFRIGAELCRNTQLFETPHSQPLARSLFISRRERWGTSLIFKRLV
jgi:hypothetical protein